MSSCVDSMLGNATCEGRRAKLRSGSAPRPWLELWRHDVVGACAATVGMHVLTSEPDGMQGTPKSDRSTTPFHYADGLEDAMQEATAARQVRVQMRQAEDGVRCRVC